MSASLDQPSKSCSTQSSRIEPQLVPRAKHSFGLHEAGKASQIDGQRDGLRYAAPPECGIVVRDVPRDSRATRIDKRTVQQSIHADRQ